MRSCAACAKRVLQPILNKGSFSEAPRIQHGQPMHQLQRFYATAAQERNEAIVLRADARKHIQNKNLNERSAGREVRKPGANEKASEIIHSKEQFMEDTAETEGLAAEREKKRLKWVVGKHLEHIKDPYQIAKHVEATLQKGRFDEALLLVQRVSKDKQCVVAWNHLIDYEMRTMKRVNAAIKLLNDMKKRGQLPNERTYTIIFRGCAQSIAPEVAVSKAVALYKSLLRDKRIQPNSFHLNAVLQVCGRAGDIEAMLDIAETVDVRAGRQATAYTYTAIINALRAKIDPPTEQGVRSSNVLKEKPTPEQDKMVRQTIERCRAIWEETTREWRNGRLKIDEDLVCAMGRMLLHGKKQERAGILSLVEETMSVPNMLRRDADKKYVRRMTEDMMGIAAPGNRSPKQVPNLQDVAYATPGHNTLSLLLSALSFDRNGKVAFALWRLFTEHFGLKPDADNYNHMMRVFERNGSSALAARLIQEMPKPFLTPTIFRRGFHACIRDNMNPTVFTNASSILASMQTPKVDSAASKHAQPRVDVRALIMYHQVATVADYNFRMMANAGDIGGSRHSHGAQLSSAVINLEGPFSAAKQELTKPASGAKAPSSRYEKGSGEMKRRQEAIEDLLVLARNMIGTVDKVANDRMINDEEQLQRLKTLRNGLNRFVVEWTDPNQNQAAPPLAKTRQTTREHAVM